MILDKFKIDGELVVITGGAGLLGLKHAEAIAEIGGIPLIIDINEKEAKEAEGYLNRSYNCQTKSYVCDITNETEVYNLFSKIKNDFGKSPYGLINNATIDPKVGNTVDGMSLGRLETFSLDRWKQELDVGLSGAFVCSKVFGSEMAKNNKGVIINISSDLGVIAPDQRLYLKKDVSEDQQKVKPVTYSVIKHGILGLTKYLATYWAKKGVRVNSLSPSGVFTEESEDFVKRITGLIPLERMARVDEYKASIAFLISDASSYMTGTNLIVDGGRTCW